MQPTIQSGTLEQPITLSRIVPAVRILAEEIEVAKGIFPFESGKTYYLPTPYNSFGAAAILAEAIMTYQEECD